MLFNELYDQWLDLYKQKVKQKTYDNTVSAFENHILPIFGTLEIEKVTSLYVLEAMQELSQKSAYLTNRLLQQIVKIYNFGKVLGYIQYNPATGVSDFLPSVKHINHPHLSFEKFRYFVQYLDTTKESTAKDALFMIIYTSLRLSEVICAEWSEIDFKNKRWTIPAHRMKNGIEHTIPITKPMNLILRKLQKKKQSNYIFFNQNKNDEHVPAHRVRYLIERSKFYGRQTIHGIRHVFSTYANEQRYNADVIEAQLSHKQKGVRAVYNKSIYLDERRRMMMNWGRKIDSIRLQST
ncbi:tyrosine-type recombinase/integrase [Pasteurella skyensis]|uniref:tyrosine-type recombinase/integrase n=1 Tax=Phocoenobacter skyensis TaxID=97481 RepID=UPI00275ECC78|nr:tyrosine-type recombinase/integrase [Pasteurella skyensis]MDP8176366.1 tyrosine-type recombinase/integrase [Pasteurella skyensis]MDP8199121.1 tyrosine-type recombinase/integrase [Pasteurella skyensis]